MKVIRFLKDWTLPVAMGIGTVLYLLFAYIPQLDGAARFFSPICDSMLPLFMFLVLFVTFCKVDFRKMRPVGWHFWVLMLTLLFIAALMAIILGTKPSSSEKILLEALLMCVIAPCASASAVVTQKLGGSLEESTTYTFISNFVTALLVPVCFPLVEKSADVHFLEAFFRILYQVMSLLVIPMLLAYIVKHYIHGLHRRIVSVRDLSFYLWGCSLAIVTGVTVKNILHAKADPMLLLAIAALGLVFCVVQFALGRLIGSFFHRKQEAGQAMGQKNTSFAIWLSITYMNPVSSIGPGCYILWQNIINSIEISAKKE